MMIEIPIERRELTLDAYQQKAARTINPNLTRPETERHALFGLAAETGEVLSLFQKELQGHPIQKDDVIKEIGDVLWMCAELCTLYDLSMGDVAQANIDKLRQRYPEGFDPERSIHREEN